MFASLLIGLVFSFGLTAHAALGQPDELSPVKADLRCEHGRSGVAVALPNGHHQGRVWQTGKGEELGLELEVVDFTVYRCPGCFDFTARQGRHLVRGVSNFYDFTYSLLKEGGDETIFQTRCLKPKKTTN